LLVLAFAAFAAGCADGPAKSWGKWKPTPATNPELDEIARIEAIGRDIYRQDQLAQRATAALIANGKHMPYPDAGGWIITGPADDVRAALIVEEGRDTRLVADVTMAKDTAPQVVIAPARALTDAESAMFRARETALRSDFDICATDFATAIEPTDAGAWNVFVYAISSKPNVIPLGRHSRYTVSADGNTVVSSEVYSMACIGMDDSADNLVVLMENRVVSDMPAPIHVFLSLTYPRPIMLATRGHLWRIANGKITAEVP
jgi:hypothetical protein